MARLWRLSAYVRRRYFIPNSVYVSDRKSSYRLDKDDSIQLRYGITYKDDGKLRITNNDNNDFRPYYVWNETNILYSPFAKDAPKLKSEPRKVKNHQTNSTIKNGFITLTSELELQPGPSFPLDGAVLWNFKTFVVDPDVYNYVRLY